VWTAAERRALLVLEFASSLTGILILPSRLVVAFAAEVVVFEHSPRPVRVATIAVPNPGGLIAASFASALALPGGTGIPAQRSFVLRVLIFLTRCSFAALLGLPGVQGGTIQLRSTDEAAGIENVTIAAHGHAIARLALSADGAMVASASEHGVCIRIHHTRHATLLHEFRRGLEQAEISSCGL
jgi:hypothetical protein